MKNKRYFVFALMVFLGILAGVRMASVGSAVAGILVPADEVGADDFRISFMGPDGDGSYYARAVAAAYNSQSNQILVVWEGCDDDPTVKDEIFGQRIDAGNAALLGNPFRISFMGDPDDDLFGVKPALAYNSQENEYLVVWAGNNGISPADAAFIYGRRVDADTGALLGSQVLLSSASDGFSPDYYDNAVDVAYNSQENEYLVVWQTSEVYGQRISASGTEVGPDNFQISHIADASGVIEQGAPEVAYNPNANQYLVVWSADLPDFNGRDNIYGQLLQAGGSQVGGDFQISQMGDGVGTYTAGSMPAVTFNSHADQYLVVWSGYEDEQAYEIYAQILTASGSETGPDDFRLSSMGAPNNDYATCCPDVAYNSLDNEYIVTWSADDDTGDLVLGELEIYVQRVDEGGNQLGEDDLRISAMGPDGNSHYTASLPTILFNRQQNRYLAFWHADDNTGSLVDNELEIYGQALEQPVDLSITITALQSDQSATLTLAVTNLGNHTAAGLQMTATLPAGLRYISAASPDGWDCRESINVITCELAHLAPAATAQVSVQVHADLCGEYAIPVAVSSFTSDSDPDNNADSVVLANDCVDLAVFGTLDPASPGLGQVFTHTLSVDNLGTLVASNVVLTDTLPLGARLVDVVPESEWQCSQSQTLVTCTLDALAPGASSPGVAVRLRLVICGRQSITASTTSDEEDPYLQNNTETLSFELACQSNFLPVVQR